MVHRPPLAPPPWLSHLPAWRDRWHGTALIGAYLLIALVCAVSGLTALGNVLGILYLLPLLLVAASSRSWWHAYVCAALLGMLAYLAYQHTPGQLPLGASTAACYLLTRVLTYSVVVLSVQALVQAALTVQTYVRALEEAHAHAWTLALTDPLTGLANRRCFDSHLEAAITRCRQQDEAVSVLLLDVDGFKQINDRWGHAAGDAALGHVAAALRASLRPGDLAARLGGDEFAAVLPATEEAHARRVAQAVQERLRAAPEGASWGPVHVSLGTASITPRSESTAEVANASAALTVLVAADRALYQVKDSTRRAAAQQGHVSCQPVAFS
jgi:diguanylate cyclase (GGDEF)-like protein